MPDRFYKRDRSLGTVRTFADGNVRVDVQPAVVLLVMAHGAVLPEDIEEAHAYADEFTGGADSLLAILADDDVTGDSEAIVLIYPNLVGTIRHRAVLGPALAAAFVLPLTGCAWLVAHFASIYASAPLV